MEQNGQAAERELEVAGIMAEAELDLTAEQFSTLSLMTDRIAFASQAGMQFKGNRDLYQEYGYPDSLEFANFANQIKREGLAGRLVDKPPKDTWRFIPIVKDGNENESRDDTDFVVSLNALAKRIKLWNALLRIDRISGVGRYGVLLIGTRGDSELQGEQSALSGPDDVLFLRAFDEGVAEIDTWVDDTGDARFGQPQLYELNMGRVGGSMSRESKLKVHNSRVIHVAEDSPNGVLGMPRLQRSFNRLMDLDKIVGSSAEAFWRLVIKPLVATSQPGYKIKESKAELEDDLSGVVHYLKRILVLSGSDVKEIGPSESPSPKESFDVVIAMIAADVEMPRNIMMGNEQGVRASDNDTTTWGGTVTNRQTGHAEPFILRPMVDWLIQYKAIPPPKSGEYVVEWLPPFTPTTKEKLEEGKEQVEILAIAANAGLVDIGLADDDEMRAAAGLSARPEGFESTAVRAIRIEDEDET